MVSLEVLKNSSFSVRSVPNNTRRLRLHVTLQGLKLIHLRSLGRDREGNIFETKSMSCMYVGLDSCYGLTKFKAFE